MPFILWSTGDVSDGHTLLQIGNVMREMEETNSRPHYNFGSSPAQVFDQELLKNLVVLAYLEYYRWITALRVRTLIK